MDINQFVQPNNPTYEERDYMLKSALYEEGRLEDYPNLKELLGPPIDITNIMPPGSAKGIKVGIIGGGLAGLSSAFELRKLGFDITVFEKQKERVGGRVYTYFFNRYKNTYGELGAMRIPVSSGTTWHYIDIFGLETRPFLQENKNGFIYVRNIRVRNDPEGINVMKYIYPQFNLTAFERSKPWQELLTYALEWEFRNLDTNTRKELLQIKKLYSPHIRELGALTTRKIMEYRLSEGAIELLSYLSFITGDFYYSSYIEILQDIYTLNTVYRYYIKGGIYNLPQSFYNSLMDKNPKQYPCILSSDLGKVNWKSGQTVSGIYRIDDDNKRVRISFRDEKSSEVNSEDFDYVICTIPFSSLRNVEIYPKFSPEKMQAIKEIGYLPTQKTLLLCNNSFWEKGNENEQIIGGSSSTDLLISSIWYPNNHYDKMSGPNGKGIYKMHYNDMSWKNPGVLLASYNLSLDAIRLGNMDEKEKVELVKRQVEKVHGFKRGYLDSVVDSYRTILWEKEQGFYGGVANYLPGQQSLFAYAAEHPEYDDRVYFAGEHISQTHAWMQGALNTGMKASNRIAEHYKYYRVK